MSLVSMSNTAPHPAPNRDAPHNMTPVRDSRWLGQGTRYTTGLRWFRARYRLEVVKRRID